MLVRTVVIATLLATTPALATLNERSVEEPTEISVRSIIDDDSLLFARDDSLIVARDNQHHPELERRIISLVSFFLYPVSECFLKPVPQSVLIFLNFLDNR